MSWPPRRRPPRRPRRTTGSIVGPEGTAYANRVRDVLRRGGVTSDGPDLPKKPRASEEATRTVVGRGRRSRPEPVPSALDGRVAMHGSLYARRRAAAGSSSRVGLPRSTELELLDAACPQRAMPLFRIPRVGDDSAHVVWKRPATGRRRRHAPRDPPSASSTATTLPITCRVLRAGPSSPRRSRGSHAPLILVAATSSSAPREQGRRRAAAGSANAADPTNYTSSIAFFASRSVRRAKVPIASRRRVRSNHTRPALIQGSPPVAQRSVAASMDRSSASAARADMSIDR